MVASSSGAGAAEFTASLYNKSSAAPVREWTLSGSDLELMRASMLLDTEPAAAARQATAILVSHPGHEAASLLLAAACRRLGDSSSAVEAMESLVRTHGDSALVQMELGRTYAGCGRGGEARTALERAVLLDDGLADAWRELSAQRLMQGDTASADAAYATYRRLATDPVAMANAYAAFDQGQLDAACALAQRGLGTGIDAVAAFTLLAAVALRRGDDMAEEAALNEVLKRAPCDNAARERLARNMLRSSRIEALPAIERLLLAAPRSSAYLRLKADALRLADRHQEALVLLMELVAVHPADAELWLLVGNQQRYLDDPAAALAAYRRAIELRPGYGLAYWALSGVTTFRFTTQDVEGMRRELTAASPEGEDAAHLEFALGRALEIEGQFAASFEHYRRANARTRATFDYDANTTTAFVRRFKATFTSGFFELRGAWGDATAAPIFIVGLPRSGSTLIEQILASHSAVEGTRELPYVPGMARELARSAPAGSLYPENLSSLRRQDVGALAARFLSEVRPHRRLGRPRFTDKMHGNFANLGLIALMFPRASIIDARRHPMGYGFACYKQLFNDGMNFAYDLKEIGLYYRDYLNLMGHVDAVLPGRVHRVHYETLVTDTESEVRRMLEYCRLPYEAGCLRFHENRRVAHTISVEQVRRPIYTESVDQWRHFEPWLEPLAAALR